LTGDTLAVIQQHYSIPTMDEMKETAMAKEVI
jgi:hypothetical protein